MYALWSFPNEHKLRNEGIFHGVFDKKGLKKAVLDHQYELGWEQAELVKEAIDDRDMLALGMYLLTGHVEEVVINYWEE